MHVRCLTRMPDKMNQLHEPDVTSERVGCRFGVKVSDHMPISKFGNFVTHNNYVAPRSVVFFENEETVARTLGNETNNSARLPQNTLPSHSAYSTDQCSSNEDNDRPTCNCNCVRNHRNQNSTRKRNTRRDLHLCIPSIMKFCFNKIFQLSITRRQDHPWRTRWIFIVLIYLFVIITANECAIGIETSGWTEPQGDIIIKYGNPLQIFCVLNEAYVEKHYPGKNSSDLMFYRNSKIMEPEFITIINRTTIMLYQELPPPSDDLYYCFLNLTKEGENQSKEGVCLNQVVIGFEPKAPNNFTCISRNWENINCTWDPPQNYVHTEYELAFKLNGGRRGVRRVYPCPKDCSNKTYCCWTQYSSPMYRQAYENYTFMMHIHNKFGSLNVTYKVDHFAQVIPEKAVNLLVLNKTSNSALLQWSLPFPLQSFPPGLTYKIMYQNHWDKIKDWKVIIIDAESQKHSHKPQFNLTGLEYANTVYDVRVFLKSAKAVGENMYSDFSVITFRTLSTLPSFPPRTDIGSFEIIENNGRRDVYLYWQTIPQTSENGDNFKYQINYVEENGHKIIIEPIEMTRTYAKFKGLSFNNYRFRIISTNKVGFNKNYTEISVPSRNEMPHEPIAFTKMAFDRGLYELSWKPPITYKDTTNPITNYTIFWCDNERDRPYQCTGFLNWIHVSKTTTVYNMTVPDPNKVYQFAISANSNKGSSGMIWSSCTVIHTKVLSKMKSVWINRIGSDFIEVGWKLDCSDRIGIVEGFKIYYCPIVSPLDRDKCKEPKESIVIKSYPPKIGGIVRNLTPYTTYMLEVATVTKNGESQPSDPLYNTTLEGAPSTSPLDVKVTNVTNTTMFITWKSPGAMNGVLRYYEVYYNELMKKVEEANHIRLTGLLAYTEYNISVAACTVACSKKSPITKQRTKIGIPGKIGMPKVRFINSSQVIVTWDPPQYPAGPIKLMYYEIDDSYGEIQNVTKMEAQLSIPDCNTVDREQQYKFRVRAVNINPNRERLTGSWSDYGEGYCYGDGLSQTVVVIMWVIGVVIAVALLSCCGYGGKRAMLKYRDMQNIGVKLPPGLTSNTKLLHKGDESHIRQPSADSSGCSSAQESVTSSLTTTEFQISSDSGTEVDPVPVSPDKLLENLSNWELNSAASLRQRSVLRGPETMSHCRESYVPVKTADPHLNEILSLARSTPNLTDSTGYTASPQTWPSTGYISMLSSEDLSGNPSPTSRGNTAVNVGGCYSVMGLARKPIQVEEDGDDGIDSAETVHDTLISVKTGVNLANNSYVPFIMKKSMEKNNKERETLKEKQKENSSTIDTFKLDELGILVDPDKFDEDALMANITASDKTMTTSKQCFATSPTSFTHTSMNTLPNLSTSLTDTSTSLTDTISSSLTDTIPIDATLTKPHVSDRRSALSDTSRLLTRPMKKNKEAFKVQKTSHNSSESFSKPAQQQQQQEKMELPSMNIMEDIKEMEDFKEDLSAISWNATTKGMDEKKPSTRLNPNRTHPIVIKQSGTGYVTIVENPNSAMLQKTASNQSDEQYSKVTVVPNTMQ
ncbi:cytokine receptor [Nylanderia fulva]|uniref:cytokine receptor n=1 Tax=Nylanderia fulva TaxID=613905 RepID=UPI0010FB2D5C|nr:cytokine receptor [Nylanderia fulva]XP_029156702.1 cytokine receptor [Nylanderia fulva]XP_029156703.1 cytokine receptor [Nylanderia fulva]